MVEPIKKQQQQKPVDAKKQIKEELNYFKKHIRQALRVNKGNSKSQICQYNYLTIPMLKYIMDFYKISYRSKDNKALLCERLDKFLDGK